MNSVFFYGFTPEQLRRRNSTLPQNCFFLAFRVEMLGGGGRERGGVEVQLWVAITLLGCAISPFWNRWEGAGLGPFTALGIGLGFFLLLSLLFKVLVNQPWRDTEPASQGLSVWAQKTDTCRAGKGKTNLTAFQEVEFRSNFGVWHYLHAQTYVWNT